MTDHDDTEAVNALAAMLERVADALEATMPKVRAAREAVLGIAPSAARWSGFDGSPDEFEASAMDGYGFNRIDSARRRIYEAVREPFDDIERQL